MLHIDTSYKFKRDDRVSRQHPPQNWVAVDCAFQSRRLTQEQIRSGLEPRSAARLLKTEALLDALREGGFDAAIGGARRDEEKSRAKERVFSFRDAWDSGTPKTSGRSFGTSTTARINTGREHTRVSPLELDRTRRLGVHPGGEHPGRAAVLCQERRDARARGIALISLSTIRRYCPAKTAVGNVPDAIAGLHILHWRRALRQPTTVADIIDELRSAKRSERENRVIDHDQEGSMETEKSEGYF